jgi:L-2,4-diaminobutyric acid acetyltransferase
MITNNSFTVIRKTYQKRCFFLNDSNNRVATLDRPVTPELVFEKPNEQDGGEMWNLVKESGVLDENSSYSYLMMCKFYKDTCAVAKCEGELAGFVTAFRPPEKPDTIFVWQIGVAKNHRGKGIATKILKELLEREDDVKYLEATVTPSNRPSESLFRGMAKKFDTKCKVTECFSAEHFPEEGHEPEMTFRVGPIR